MCRVDAVAVAVGKKKTWVNNIEGYGKSQNRENIGASQDTGNDSLDKGVPYVLHT